MTEQNKLVVQRWFEEVWNRGNLQANDELLAPEFVNHDPHNPEIRDCEALKRWVSDFRAAFPDARFSTDDLIAEGDKVVHRWTLTATIVANGWARRRPAGD